MIPVRHYSWPILSPPIAEGGPIRLRTFSPDQELAHADAQRWLWVRAVAFADAFPPARNWTLSEFQAQILHRPWWNPEHCWFAEVSETGQTVGMVTLGFRDAEQARTPCVHWLAVVPEFRRQGVGRLLMTALAAKCWQLGHRQVLIETHSNWREAVAFYEKYCPQDGD